MEEAFYKDRLREKYGLRVLVPDDAGRADVHRVIYEELCQGNIRSGSKQRFLGIIDELGGNGAQAVVLGCTEIGLLVEQPDTTMRLYDTTAVHADQAVEAALSQAAL